MSYRSISFLSYSTFFTHIFYSASTQINCMHVNQQFLLRSYNFTTVTCSFYYAMRTIQRDTAYYMCLTIVHVPLHSCLNTLRNPHFIKFCYLNPFDRLSNIYLFQLRLNIFVYDRKIPKIKRYTKQYCFLFCMLPSSRFENAALPVWIQIYGYTNNNNETTVKVNQTNNPSKQPPTHQYWCIVPIRTLSYLFREVIFVFASLPEFHRGTQLLRFLAPSFVKIGEYSNGIR